MYEYKAEVLRWVDGDTVLVRVDLGFHCERQERVRLARINAWEMRDESAYRRRWARSARFQAHKICPPGSKVVIQTSKSPHQDRYARYIAEIIFRGQNISDQLKKLKGVEEY